MDDVSPSARPREALKVMAEWPYSERALPTPRLALALAVAAVLLVGGPTPDARAAGEAQPDVRADAPSGATFLFPYQQRRFLYSRNAKGGLAYVTSGAARGASLPVVVFLHGMNPDELVHPWFGPPYGDLRPVVESLVTSGKVAPLVIAAPTHTRYATGATVMWPHFDLEDFLATTEAALGGAATIDRTRIIVVGHSGAGCNASGGILAESVRRARPRALLDVDGCVNETVAGALAQASQATPVHFFWQRTWARPVSELANACPACKVEEITDLAGSSPHVAILPEALNRALPSLLPPDPAAPR